jgi:hypothetical protein
MNKTLTDDQKTIKDLRRQISQLKEQGNRFFDQIICRETYGMFLYPKDKLNISWTLSDVYERAHAAQTLGYNVLIRVDDKGLHVDYAKKLPNSRPWAF